MKSAPLFRVFRVFREPLSASGPRSLFASFACFAGTLLLCSCATTPHDPRDPAHLRRAPAKLLPLP
jgi:hypothetical protein